MQLKDRNSCIPAVHWDVGVIDRPNSPAPLTVLSCDWLRSVLSSNNGALPLQIWKQYIIQRNNELFLHINYILHRWRVQNIKRSWKAK